ncbi:MAG: hypothetical protein QNJ46_30970 [Leptolyngbyaceae cyanobacterium MO_188.B28]|nr:hypothetical protein [Leptolyngbyaceae cyanobacterium MO_188.B28]
MATQCHPFLAIYVKDVKDVYLSLNSRGLKIEEDEGMSLID